MQQYDITGMSCAACSARVEKAVSALKGIDSCSVNLLTNSMTVEGSAAPKDIISAVEKAGYGARSKNTSHTNEISSASLDSAEKETSLLIKRLVSSLIFLAVLMYFSMGHSMLGLPLPYFFENNYIAITLMQLLLSAAVMVINQKFFKNGFKGIIHKAPNMDTLVALGSGASFVYSTCVLFAMTDTLLNGKTELVKQYSHEVYFEAAAMILALITVGKMLESRSKNKTTNAIKSLMSLTPKTANIIQDGKEITVPSENVKAGDIFIVRPGESIPVDGVVIEGESAVNESALTGESIPADKAVGSTVSAATINTVGVLRCKAVHVGQDTTLAQIIKTVTQAAATKAPAAKAADKAASIFVPAVLIISAVTFALWLIAGEAVGFSLARAVSVLVISCPCALGLATPVAIMVGSGVGAKNGILFKTAAALEETGKAQIAVLDKTGTVTHGTPSLTDILPINSMTKDEFLKLAYSLEVNSEHPLSKAVSEQGKKQFDTPLPSSSFKTLSGSGVKAVINDSTITGGNKRLIQTICTLPDYAVKKGDELAAEGKTPLYFAKDNEYIGTIAVADTIRAESIQAIKELTDMGIHVVMLTGDNEKTANAVGSAAGVDNVIAGVLPNDKADVIKQLTSYGKTLMVGDGINDAPALTAADSGIAVGAGTDIAIDSADVVLMKSKLTDVPAAIRLSRKTLRNIHENLFWAFIYNIMGIPLAAGIYYPIFGLKLNPMFGAAAMSISSLCVVSNALRLNFADVYNSRRDKKAKPIKENIKIERKKKDMEVTLKIKGMMCPHCEATVKKALEEFAQVDCAQPSFKENKAVVKLNSDIDVELLKKAVIDKGYEVE